MSLNLQIRGNFRLFAKRVCEEKEVDYFLIHISSNNLHSQHAGLSPQVLEGLGKQQVLLNSF